MDRVRAVVLTLLLAAGAARAGEVAPAMVWTSTAPSGSCKGNRVVFETGTGKAWCCSGSTWAACGQVQTATALAADPVACGASAWVRDLAANGSLSCATPSFADISGVLDLADLPAHTHAAADVTSGTLTQARGGTGAGSLTCSADNVLTSNGSVYSCTGYIGAAGYALDLQAVGPAVSVSEIDASGTPDATTYLRGDGTWGTPSGGGTTWKSLVAGRSSAALTATAFLYPVGTVTAGASYTVPVAMPVPFSGTLRNLYCNVDAGQGAGDYCVCILRKGTNPFDSGSFSDALSCTISEAGATTCSQTAATVAVTQGEYLFLFFWEQAGTCIGTLSWSFEIGS